MTEKLLHRTYEAGSILCAVAEGRHGAGHTTLNGEDADALRVAYYEYWSAVGRPDTELHRCLARGIYAAESVQLWFIRPALATLLGRLEWTVER